MPMKKQYISRNGQIEYEIDEAGEILTYGRDALGNVVAGYDKNTNAVFTLDYKPFGEFAATTGTITGRRFLWVGTWGYRFTSGVPVSHYIRTRHLSMRMGMWTTVDPLWPSEMAFGYVDGNPLYAIDQSGLVAIPIACGIACGVTAACAAGVWIACGELWGVEPEFNECVSEYLQSLPPISLIGCGAGLAGCLMCLGRFIPKALPRRSPCGQGAPARPGASPANRQDPGRLRRGGRRRAGRSQS